jgi:hypothetical protein
MLPYSTLVLKTEAVGASNMLIHLLTTRLLTPDYKCPSMVVLFPKLWEKSYVVFIHSLILKFMRRHWIHQWTCEVHTDIAKVKKNEYAAKSTDEHITRLPKSIQYTNEWGINRLPDTGYAPLIKLQNYSKPMTYGKREFKYFSSKRIFQKFHDMISKLTHTHIHTTTYTQINIHKNTYTQTHTHKHIHTNTYTHKHIHNKTCKIHRKYLTSLRSNPLAISKLYTLL